MNRMSSIDTPLNTLKRLQDKQREMRSPYVILSGKKAP
jgi:U4/U6.U5 tri-snRNP-associated protein 1